MYFRFLVGLRASPTIHALFGMHTKCKKVNIAIVPKCEPQQSVSFKRVICVSTHFVLASRTTPNPAHQRADGLDPTKQADQNQRKLVSNLEARLNKVSETKTTQKVFRF